MMTPSIARDERTVAVEHASYRWAYLVMTFGLLGSVAYRSVVRHEQSWDLLALILVGGVVAVGYQGSQRILDRRWLLLSILTIAVALVLALVIAPRR